MSLESIVKGLVSKYENEIKKTRKRSTLYLLAAEYAVLANNGTEKALGDTVAKPFAYHEFGRATLEYLNWRLPKLNAVYAKVTPEAIVNELYIFFYLEGWLPRIVDGREVYLSSDDDLKHMSITRAHLKGRENELIEDERFYKLVSRISQGHHRDKCPDWRTLVSQVLQFPELKERYSQLDSLPVYTRGPTRVKWNHNSPVRVRT